MSQVDTVDKYCMYKYIHRISGFLNHQPSTSHQHLGAVPNGGIQVLERDLSGGVSKYVLRTNKNI